MPGSPPFMEENTTTLGINCCRLFKSMLILAIFLGYILGSLCRESLDCGCGPLEGFLTDTPLSVSGAFGALLFFGSIILLFPFLTLLFLLFLLFLLSLLLFLALA